jgi:Ser/Thr protein kinase RdoA (MazF antagonist)/acetylornithine/succinyldiaminopimelate/putrescine aminotransferase
MALSPTTHRKVSAEDAARLGRELFGLESSEVSELPSERDQNFLLRSAVGPRVLKLDGPTESDAVLNLQNSALAWIAQRAPELPVPRVLGRSKDGRTRLLSYRPGTILAEARPRSLALFAKEGNLLGRLDVALAGFRHPAAAGRDLPWDPARASEVLERHRDAIEDPRRRELVSRVHALYTAEIAPLLPRLPRSVIHNDANDYNVLIGPPTRSAGEREVTGLLDFGDMVETWTVCELAVAVAYAIFGQDRPLPAAESLVAGYHAARPLSDAELDAVWILAAVRLCTSVCLSAHRRRAASGNAYHFVSETSAWEALGRMAEVHPRFARAALRAAAGAIPFPQTPSIEAWLRARRDRGELAPLIGADADLSRAVVFDLSVGSPEFRTPAETLDTAAMTPRLFSRMREAGTNVGIGRYDEARLVYGGDAFAGSLGEHPERRTIHIALDVFMEPGSPVHAPLAGRVHAVHDNAARYDYGPTLILEHAPEDAPRFYTLYGHLAPDVLQTLSPGDSVARGQRVASIGAPPGNGDWPPHVHFQIVTDMLDGGGEFHGVGAASERAVWLGLSPDPSLAVAGARPDFRAPAASPASLREHRRRRLGPNLSLSYRDPLEIVRGAGAHLFDERGRAFLDMVNNVAHVGHAHPRVAAAGARQMTVLNTNTRYLHPSIVRYAERLAATLPDPLAVCFFVNSGSEANELALRMARAHTGRRGVIVLGGAYHGNTQGLIDVSPYKFDGPGGGGRPGPVRVVPMPDDYRGIHRRDDPLRAEKYAAHVADAARGGEASAFLCESLLSCGGQIVLPPGYLAAAYRHARAAGSVCIADEVQIGFGRVGSHFWGFETQGPDVVPDIVTMGKPIGNGHPLGAVVTTPAIAASFANGME